MGQIELAFLSSEIGDDNEVLTCLTSPEVEGAEVEAVEDKCLETIEILELVVVVAAIESGLLIDVNVEFNLIK